MKVGGGGVRFIETQKASGGAMIGTAIIIGIIIIDIPIFSIVGLVFSTRNVFGCLVALMQGNPVNTD